MRYSASEKAEIIKLVEQSHLPARHTLDKLGIPRATFYRWYDRYRGSGIEALADHRSRPDRVWNRIPDDVRGQIIDLALELPELSPRELAVRFTDEKKYFVSEASVYRLLKAHDLITSPAYVVIKAANEFKEDHRHQPALADRLHLPQDHWLGLVLPVDRARRLLALHRRLEAWPHHVRLGRHGHARPGARGLRPRSHHHYAAAPASE
jgi:transposase-like protein